LVELNRSPWHRDLFSEITRSLPRTEKMLILSRYYAPYRERVERFIADATRSGATVLHLSVHTFTPNLDGRLRNAELGLLYDPRRTAESAYCDGLRASISKPLPELRVRRNYPYRGRADGLTTWLRRRFAPSCYLGIEIEVNQRLLSEPAAWKRLRRLLPPLVRDVAASGRLGREAQTEIGRRPGRRPRPDP
jgi:predicted N-formylglutamate amidohydrolase